MSKGNKRIARWVMSGIPIITRPKAPQRNPREMGLSAPRLLALVGAGRSWYSERSRIGLSAGVNLSRSRDWSNGRRFKSDPRNPQGLARSAMNGPDWRYATWSARAEG